MGAAPRIAALAALLLAGCGQDAAVNVANQPAPPASVSDSPTTAAAASAAPAHAWTYKDGQDYGYPAAISEEEQKNGQAAASITMIRYLGAKDGVYRVQLVDLGVVASCTNPCQVIKFGSGPEAQRFVFNPLTIAGEAFTDAFNGQLAVYTPAATVKRHRSHEHCTTEPRGDAELTTCVPAD